MRALGHVGGPDLGAALAPLLAVASRRLARFSASPSRFVVSGFLAGIGIAFVHLAAVAVRAPLAAAAPGLDRLVLPVLVSAGLTLLVIVGRLEVSVGAGAHLSLGLLEGRGGAGRPAAAVAVCALANVAGSAGLAAAMARAGMLDRVHEPLAELSAGIMRVPAGRVVMQALIGGLWLGLVALAGSMAPTPRWRVAAVSGGFFLFVALGFRLATAEGALHAVPWILGEGPRLGARPLAVHVMVVMFGNVMGAAALAAGLVWWAQGDNHRRAPAAHPFVLLRAAPDGGVRMYAAISRPRGRLRAHGSTRGAFAPAARYTRRTTEPSP
jgi:nitrite transporter NirC